MQLACCSVAKQYVASNHAVDEAVVQLVNEESANWLVTEVENQAVNGAVNEEAAERMVMVIELPGQSVNTVANPVKQNNY